MINRILLESRCDKCIYSVVPPSPITRVATRDLSLPTLSDGKPIEQLLFELPPVASYLRISQLQEAPLNPGEAILFLRTVYELLKRPVWTYHIESQSLVIFPPTINDGDLIIVEYEESQHATAHSTGFIAPGN